MPGRNKRNRIEDFDPNASDPNDSDFDDKPSSPPARRSRSSKKPHSGRHKKRSRPGYRDSDNEIVDDDDDISEDSFASDSEESEEEPETNPRTGRAVRNATKKNIKYEDPSEEEIEDDEEVPVVASRRNKKKKLVVKLKLPVALPEQQDQTEQHNTRSSRTRSGRLASKSVQPEATPNVRTRRSAQLSEDREEPLQALSYTGRERDALRSATRSLSPQRRGIRPTQGRKGPVKQPSIIMEASQEASGPSVHSPPPSQHKDEEQEQVHASQAASVASEIQYEAQTVEDAQVGEVVIQESDHGQEDEESDEGPITRGRKPRSQPSIERPVTRGSQKRRADESSDFEPVEEDKQGEDVSDSEGPPRKRQKSSTDDSLGRRQSTRLKTKASQRSRRNSDSEEELDQDELADEAAALAQDRRKNRRTTRSQRHEGINYEVAPKLRNRGQRPDYTIATMKDLFRQDEEEAEAAVASTPSRNKRGRTVGWRPLFTTQGPFGGAGGPAPLLGAAPRLEPLGDVDSDSSDDEEAQGGQRGPSGLGGAVGMTPTSAAAGLVPHAHNADQLQKGIGGGPANLGKINNKKSLADTDPLSVTQNVNFDSVGGLDDHINQLKEMVTLPLLYPEIFQKFHVTPPRGVLFHGPPGTGKTLLARALANAVSTNGKKVTFYMRKGADALSKWVGEAERQLRLLFEEARKNQPSIIFFDEIDGIAPVRSSRSEQIHASIVATLLALMDGMDDRGQVVVIGATNRPDSVDPALRRPGRFDREFYFPLPNQEARRAIINIHTKAWDPPLADSFKDQLAELTKGYGGADLRALCTEAAVNAVQGTFPQIYLSNKKLVIDTDKIKVSAKDFMISVNKIVPSSERSTSFGATPLSKSTEPLLRSQLADIVRVIDEIIPPKKKMTALEEAQYDDRNDDFGFEREALRRDFEHARIFRPRLLVRGFEGMGQQSIGAALLHRFEGMHVQSFDLPSLLGDTSGSPEATLVQLFKEVRRHKPSVIYIPHVDVWYQIVSKEVISTFTSLLRTMPASDPVLILGTMEQQDENDQPDPFMLKDLFGFSTKNQYELKRPDEPARKEYFENIISYIRKAPKEFPDPNRKKRKFEELEEAPEAQEEEKKPTKEELKLQKKRDRHYLNQLKVQLQPIMDQLKLKYRKFRNSVIDDTQIRYLYEERNPEMVTTDVPDEVRNAGERPFELAYDQNSVKGLVEVATGKFYYNLNIAGIEERLSHGYYKRPKDFLEDVISLAKDARNSGDYDRTLKANEMLANVEVDITNFEENRPDLVAACEGVYQREQERRRQVEEKAQKAVANGQQSTEVRSNVPPAHDDSHAASESTGPVMLGEPIPGAQHMPPITPTRRIGPSPLSNGLSNSNTTPSRQRQSNGSTAEGDGSHMDDSQGQDALNEHRDKRPRLLDDGPHSAPDTQGFSRSQRSGHTQMAPNTQPGDYQNSASTTTSGQKTSDRSHRSSGPYSNTQSTTNGVAPGPHPDFASGPALSGGSQIPDTQEVFPSSQPTNSQALQSSQHFPVPALPAARQQPAITSLLNSNEQQPAPRLIVDEGQLDLFHVELVHRSSGLSVEQLEQVNSAMMAAIWKERGDWNRNRVLKSATSAFNETIADIEHMQKVWPPSQLEKQ